MSLIPAIPIFMLVLVIGNNLRLDVEQLERLVHKVLKEFLEGMEETDKLDHPVRRDLVDIKVSRENLVVMELMGRAERTEGMEGMQ